LASSWELYGDRSVRLNQEANLDIGLTLQPHLQHYREPKQHSRGW
jgi:hypothetical protein